MIISQRTAQLASQRYHNYYTHKVSKHQDLNSVSMPVPAMFDYFPCLLISLQSQFQMPLVFLTI